MQFTIRRVNYIMLYYYIIISYNIPESHRYMLYELPLYILLGMLIGYVDIAGMISRRHYY